MIGIFVRFAHCVCFLVLVLYTFAVMAGPPMHSELVAPSHARSPTDLVDSHTGLGSISPGRHKLKMASWSSFDN